MKDKEKNDSMGKDMKANLAKQAAYSMAKSKSKNTKQPSGKVKC